MRAATTTGPADRKFELTDVIRKLRNDLIVAKILLLNLA